MGKRRKKKVKTKTGGVALFRPFPSPATGETFKTLREELVVAAEKALTQYADPPPATQAYPLSPIQTPKLDPLAADEMLAPSPPLVVEGKRIPSPPRALKRERETASKTSEEDDDAPISSAQPL